MTSLLVLLHFFLQTNISQAKPLSPEKIERLELQQQISKSLGNSKTLRAGDASYLIALFEQKIEPAKAKLVPVYLKRLAQLINNNKVQLSKTPPVLFVKGPGAPDINYSLRLKHLEIYKKLLKDKEPVNLSLIVNLYTEQQYDTCSKQGLSFLKTTTSATIHNNLAIYTLACHFHTLSAQVPKSLVQLAKKHLNHSSLSSTDKTELIHKLKRAHWLMGHSKEYQYYSTQYSHQPAPHPYLQLWKLLGQVDFTLLNQKLDEAQNTLKKIETLLQTYQDQEDSIFARASFHHIQARYYLLRKQYDNAKMTMQKVTNLCTKGMTPAIKCNHFPYYYDAYLSAVLSDDFAYQQELLGKLKHFTSKSQLYTTYAGVLNNLSSIKKADNQKSIKELKEKVGPKHWISLSLNSFTK